MSASTRRPTTTGDEFRTVGHMIHHPDLTTRRSAPASTHSGVLRRFYSPLVQRRTWRETLALLLALPLGAVWFTLAVSGLSLAAGLLVTVVGLPLLAGVVLFGRAIGTVERAQARRLLGADMPSFAGLADDGSWWIRTRRAMRDRAGWKGLLYAVASLPTGIVWFTITTVMWTVALAAATFPVYQAFLPETGDSGPYRIGSYVLHGWGRVGGAVATTAVGLVLLGITPRVVHAMAGAQQRLVRALLAPSTDDRAEPIGG
jgi:hypothetical protein